MRMLDDWDVLEDEEIACRKCPRLVAWREQVAREKRRAYREWDYWGRPVPAFGDRAAQVLVVGLAPGAHGANRTGRMFTGDGSGDFLYRALHQAGFANQPSSRHRGDGLALDNLLISAVCRCAPPQNRPTAGELGNCRSYLVREIELLADLQVIVALGRLAYEGVRRSYQELGYDLPPADFGHHKWQRLGSGLPWLLTSYHPSRQNTQTGRLTEAMFAEVWETAHHLLAP